MFTYAITQPQLQAGTLKLKNSDANCNLNAPICLLNC